MGTNHRNINPTPKSKELRTLLRVKDISKNPDSDEGERGSSSQASAVDSDDAI